MASRSLNYLHHTMEKKTAAQQWHRVTHRLLLDLQHRCMRRTAPEEWNLATNAHEQDATAAEFVRTFQSISFNGRDLLQRLEGEKKKEGVSVTRVTDGQKNVWLPERIFI